MVERRKFVLLGAFAIGGALFGFSVSSIPSPSDPTVFWVGNFSSPWAVLAFVAGWSLRSGLWAAYAGAVADIACVVGFYCRFLTLDPNAFGLERSTDVASGAVRRVEQDLVANLGASEQDQMRRLVRACIASLTEPPASAT